MKIFLISLFSLFLVGCSAFSKPQSSIEAQVISVNSYFLAKDSTSYNGAVIGGLVGGLLGNQVGKGSGRKVATVAGLGAGALAGHTIDNTPDQYLDITLRDKTGKTFIVTQLATSKIFLSGQWVTVDTYSTGRQNVTH